MKRWILAVCIAVLTGLTGCARDESAKQQADGDRMKITVAFWNAEDALVGDAVLDAVEERFGVTFEPVNMTWNDYYQKVERWAATDSLPDLFVGDFRNSRWYTQWVQKGLLCAIPEDLSEYPHLEQYMQNLQLTQISLADGRMYCIPRQTYPSQEWTSIDRIIVYRWDLAQKAGITKEPENWEEFQEMILAIMAADPENTGIQGMSVGNAGLITGALLPYASSVAVGSGTDFCWKEDMDGVYKPAYFVDDLTSAFQLGRDMYTSGVLVKDLMLETTNMARDRFLRGESAAIVYSGGFGATYERVGEYWESFHENPFTEDVRALKLMPDVHGEKTYPVWGYAWSESYISARAGEEKRDKILQIYDYLLSDEGAFFAAYGPEGDLYEVVDGRVKLQNPDMAVSAKYPSCALLSILVRWDSSLYDDRFPAPVPEAYVRVNQELVEEARQVKLPEYEPECYDIMKEEQIDFSIHVNDDFLRIITGDEPVEEIWAEIRKEYEAEGLQEMIDIVNDRMQQRELDKGQS